jgi:enoyl-CoA hydratase/carnithine racemase
MSRSAASSEDMTFLADLTEVIHALQGNREARVAIVRGAGRAFCSGVDLKALSGGRPDPAFFTVIEDLWDILQESDKAVICAIHGYCLGGGRQVALAFDLRIGSGDAIVRATCRQRVPDPGPSGLSPAATDRDGSRPRTASAG